MIPFTKGEQSYSMIPIPYTQSASSYLRTHACPGIGILNLSKDLFELESMKHMNGSMSGRTSLTIAAQYIS